MSDCVREMTREELLAELIGSQQYVVALKNECDNLRKQVLDLKAENAYQSSTLEEARMNEMYLGNPIEVAEVLIDKKAVDDKIELIGLYQNCYYSKSELKQIAEHLLVYVNNNEDRK